MSKGIAPFSAEVEQHLHQTELSVITSHINDKQMIPFIKKYLDITGSYLGSLLLKQCMYWSAKKEHGVFYKFISPCDHSLYKEGDSWEEETWGTARQIGRALDKFSVKLTKSVKREDNPNAILYRWTKENCTYYELNRSYLSKVLTLLDHPDYEKGMLSPFCDISRWFPTTKDRSTKRYSGNTERKSGNTERSTLYIQENTQETTTGDLLPTDSPLPTVESSLQLEEKLKKDFDFSLNEKSTYNDHYDVAEKVIKLLNELPYTRKVTIADTLCLTYTDDLGIKDREPLTQDLTHFDRLPRILTEVLAILRLRQGGVLTGAYLLKRYLTGFKQLDDGVAEECMHYTYFEADLMLGRFHRRKGMAVHKKFQVDAIKALHQANAHAPIGFGILVDRLLAAHPDKTNTAYFLNTDVVHSVAAEYARE